MPTIKTAKHAYFYSGSIYLNPDKTLDVGVDSLSAKEIEDILEGYDRKNLIISESDVTSFKSALKNKQSSSGGGSIGGASTGTSSPSTGTGNYDAAIDSLKQDVSRNKTELEALSKVNIPDFVSLLNRQLT